MQVRWTIEDCSAPGVADGRIITAEGEDIYFHRNSVLNADFDALEIGMEVRFVAQEGDEGPQVSSVRLIGKHHIVE